MKPAYIYIGLAAVAVISTGVLIRQFIKTGEYKARIKAAKETINDLSAYNSFLEHQADDMEKTILTDKKTIAKFQLRENIYIDKIKVDSLLLKEVKQSNERLDSITSDWNLDDWNKFITADFEDEISEN